MMCSSLTKPSLCVPVCVGGSVQPAYPDGAIHPCTLVDAMAARGLPSDVVLATARKLLESTTYVLHFSSCFSLQPLYFNRVSARCVWMASGRLHHY